MIVEHTFVTTLDVRDAFTLANDCLVPKGFMIQDGTPGRAQQWRRGKKSASQSRGVLKLPQSLRMEFDRGRINLAACIENDPRRKKRSQKLMIAYAESLEALLADHHQSIQAFAGSDAVEKSIRRSETNRRCAAIAVLLLVVGGIGALAYSASRAAPSAPSRPARPQMVSAPRILPERKRITINQPAPSQPVPRPTYTPPRTLVTSAPNPAKAKPPPQVTVRRVPPSASKPDE